MFVVRKAAPKKQDKNDTTAQIEKDLWYSKRGMKWVNNWDIKLTQELREIEEPAALREVELGHDFLAVGTKYFEELKIMCDVQQALDETATVVKGVRRDAQMVWQQGLGKREEK